MPFTRVTPDPETAKVVWAPNEGFQTELLLNTGVDEVLCVGARGSGKSDALLLDFLQYVGLGYGGKYKGMI